MATFSPAEIPLLKSSVFYGSLPEGLFLKIAEHSRLIEMAAGEILFRQGEPGKAIFAVLSGLIKLTVDRSDGQEVMVDCFESGTSFAEAMAFGAACYPVSAAAITNSRVLMTPVSVIDEAIVANPEGYKALLRATYHHLHLLVRQVEELKGSSGTDRVARYIQAVIDAEADKLEVEIPFDKKVLAAKLGIKPESLSRAFRRLDSHGVSVKKSTIKVLDVGALDAFVDQKNK